MLLPPHPRLTHVVCGFATDDADKRPPVSVKFEIPYFTTSGIQVRYLKIIEKSGYQALPWVRYITQNGGTGSTTPTPTHSHTNVQMACAVAQWWGRVAADYELRMADAVMANKAAEPR
jgi:hypothetical protein